MTLSFFINIIYDVNPQLDPTTAATGAAHITRAKPYLNFMDIAGNLKGFIMRMLGEASFDLQAKGLKNIFKKPCK